MNVMPIPELIARVTEICKKNGVKNCICLVLLQQVRQRRKVISILLSMDATICGNWRRSWKKLIHFGK